jgi:signal transduction histidine kinase
VAEILSIPVDRELGERVGWLIKWRWVVVPVVALGAYLAHVALGRTLPMRGVLLTCLAILLYNAFFWILAHRLLPRDGPHAANQLLMDAQVIADLVALTFLLHYTGGIENPLSTYYVLLVVIGSVLMTRRSGYLYAAIASMLWVCLLGAEAVGWIPHYNLRGFRSPVRYHEWSHILSEGFVVTTGTFAAALLVSRVIDRLRAGEEQLYGANVSCELRAGELVELNRRLQDLDRQRSLFIRVVTHELRAPVAAIQSYLQLILEGYVPEERTREIVAKAERRARDQLDLIGDLLELSRVGVLRQEAVVPCDAGAVLRDVVDMFQARATERQITVQVQTAAGLPLVRANQEHIKQVWVNLISNAIKYTPPGGSVSISLGGDALGSNAPVIRGSVRDTGIGIAPADQGRIFENFYRTEKAKEMARDGTGLGLSIVAEIIKRYGGTITLESDVGRGSLFAFELPAAAGTSAGS